MNHHRLLEFFASLMIAIIVMMAVTCVMLFEICHQSKESFRLALVLMLANPRQRRNEEAAVFADE